MWLGPGMMIAGLSTYRNLPSLLTASSPGNPPGEALVCPSSVRRPWGEIANVEIAPWPLPMPAGEPAGEASVLLANAYRPSLETISQHAARPPSGKSPLNFRAPDGLRLNDAADPKNCDASNGFGGEPPGSAAVPDGVATKPASLTSRLFCPANEKPNGFGVGAWWPTAGPAAPCQSTENTSITPLGAGSPRM